MARNLKNSDIYVGPQSCYLAHRTTFGNRPWNDGSTARAFVLGWQFGPVMLAVGCAAEDALDEFDERHGERVDVDDAALADYQGATAAERIEDAMKAGDIRVNSGGTLVWVDPYEWIRGFRTVAEAGRFYRGEA